MITLALPFPISVNAMRTVSRTTGRIVDSPAYRAWKREADALFLTQKRKVGCVRGRFEAFLTLDETRPRRLDPDNSAKCVLDALQRWGVIRNDRLCDELHIGWGFAPEGCRVALYEFSPRIVSRPGGNDAAHVEVNPFLEVWTGRR